MDKIRAYVEQAFEDAPHTKKMGELKEELTANLTDKYQDLIAKGKGETESCNSVISGIGDLSELIDSVREPEPLLARNPREQKQRALLTAVAVGLYILSPVVMIVLGDSFGLEVGALAGFFLCIAVATGILIFNYMTRPVYLRADDSLVEDFKEWRGKSQRQRAAMASFKSAYWSITVVIYLLVSFFYMAWLFSWILFIAAAAGWQVIRGIIEWKGEEKWN